MPCLMQSGNQADHQFQKTKRRKDHENTSQVSVWDGRIGLDLLRGMRLGATAGASWIARAAADSGPRFATPAVS